MSALPKPFFQNRLITLYHGDARELLVRIPSRSIDMIFTDPPYGHNNNNGDLIHRREAALGKDPRGVTRSARPIAGDDAETASELVQMLFAESARILRCCCCCCCCCCGGGGPDPQFGRWALWMDEYLRFKQMVIWDKGPMGLGWHYRRSYETILVAQQGKGKTRWYDRTRRIENIIRSGDYGIKKIIPRAEHHPTEKPPALAAHFIRLHSYVHQTVLDPFAGGGSTLLASQRLSRRAIGIEVEKNWCEAIVDKLRKETAVANITKPFQTTNRKRNTQ